MEENYYFVIDGRTKGSWMFGYFGIKVNPYEVISYANGYIQAIIDTSSALGALFPSNSYTDGYIWRWYTQDGKEHQAEIRKGDGKVLKGIDLKNL